MVAVRFREILGCVGLGGAGYLMYSYVRNVIHDRANEKKQRISPCRQFLDEYVRFVRSKSRMRNRFPLFFFQSNIYVRFVRRVYRETPGCFLSGIFRRPLRNAHTNVSECPPSAIFLRCMEAHQNQAPAPYELEWCTEEKNAYSECMDSFFAEADTLEK